MNSLFVTGTDTGAGKTVVSRLLERYLKDAGHNAAVQKWIRTGSKNRRMAVCTFRFPCSPHLAAHLEKKTINAEKIKSSFRQLSKQVDFVIVEGVGGALVPFNRKRLVLDIARELKLPVLIVVDNKLGAINHALLTIEAVKKRGMKIIGLIFNNSYRKTDKIILEDNPKIVKASSGERILGILPRIKDKNLLYKKFKNIAGKIRWIAG